MPSAFTPNGDGKNDFLYPLNAVKANNLEFKVYNRMGQLVFLLQKTGQKNGMENKWPAARYRYLCPGCSAMHMLSRKGFSKGTTLLHPLTCSLNFYNKTKWKCPMPQSLCPVKSSPPAGGR
ncbi:MAG: gliding motility-associated C-terminal domain-containing protein [Chitinophagaceae bacterium]|nr:gliding motility-associated C-terminal domain-containing protein [Chitinophagaceae bacterium]